MLYQFHTEATDISYYESDPYVNIHKVIHSYVYLFSYATHNAHDHHNHIPLLIIVIASVVFLSFDENLGMVMNTKQQGI